MHQGIRDETKTRIVKHLLLNTKDDTKIGLRTHFAKRAEELQIQNNSAFIARCQIRKKLVYNNQISLVRIFLIERHHHILDEFLIIFNGIKIGNIVINSTSIKVFLNKSKKDLTKRHGNAADLNTQNFKLTGYRFHALGKLFILEILQVVCIFSNSGDDRHQVGFTCTIVTNNKDTLVINNLVHLQLVYNGSLETICHRVGHNISLHIFSRLISIISRGKLDDIFYRVKTNQF